MTCASCAVSVESILSFEEGVVSAAVNYANATAIVEYIPGIAKLENFKKAIAIDANDPNLYFNLGRLYFDWQRWPDCLAQAEKALNLNAGFTQAKQLADYVRKLPQ